MLLKSFLLSNASVTHCFLCRYILVSHSLLNLLSSDFTPHHFTGIDLAKVTFDLLLGESSRVL